MIVDRYVDLLKRLEHEAIQNDNNWAFAAFLFVLMATAGGVLVLGIVAVSYAAELNPWFGVVVAVVIFGAIGGFLIRRALPKPKPDAKDTHGQEDEDWFENEGWRV